VFLVGGGVFVVFCFSPFFFFFFCFSWGGFVFFFFFFVVFVGLGGFFWAFSLLFLSPPELCPLSLSE